MRTDEELMKAYAAGDGQAFRELFERYAAMLTRVTRRQMGREEDVLDLVQQTFLQVHRARNDYRGDGPFRAWLFRIAQNVRREHFRKRQRRPEEPLELEGELEPRVDATHERRVDDRQQLAGALAQLSQGQRQVIHLHWYEGLSFPEIADAVGASVSAVKVRAHRGYKVLRRALGVERRPG